MDAWTSEELDKSARLMNCMSRLEDTTGRCGSR
jgi:hypothetical protein